MSGTAEREGKGVRERRRKKKRERTNGDGDINGLLLHVGEHIGTLDDDFLGGDGGLCW